MKVYLNNYCYNRPYDDQSYLKISLEAQANEIKLRNPVEFISEMEV